MSENEEGRICQQITASNDKTDHLQPITKDRFKCQVRDRDDDEQKNLFTSETLQIGI